MIVDATVTMEHIATEHTLEVGTVRVLDEFMKDSGLMVATTQT